MRSAFEFKLFNGEFWFLSNIVTIYLLKISWTMSTKGIRGRVSINTLDRYSQSTLNQHPINTQLTLHLHLSDTWHRVGILAFSKKNYQNPNPPGLKIMVKSMVYFSTAICNWKIKRSKSPTLGLHVTVKFLWVARPPPPPRAWQWWVDYFQSMVDDNGQNYTLQMSKPGKCRCGIIIIPAISNALNCIDSNTLS